jgi:Sec-independent protein translocase protein TatA
MQILNVGPLELVFIVLIALIVLGPDEMIQTGRKLAKAARKFVRSPIWKSLVSTSQEIKEIPRKFMREAGLDETMQELNHLNRFPEGKRRIKPPLPPQQSELAVGKSEKAEQLAQTIEESEDTTNIWVDQPDRQDPPENSTKQPK